MSKNDPSSTSDAKASRPNWKPLVAKYQTPCSKRAIWQLINTVGLYALLMVAIYFSLKVSWWLTIPLSIFAGAIVIRVFIIFHDCGHGSFFKNKKANDFWGFVTGMLTFSPYGHWKWEHSVHHATNGHLDRRGIGDIWTMTVEEYLNVSPGKRFSYRLSRNPVVLFVIAPLFIFLVKHRYPQTTATKSAKQSVWKMNIALLLMVVVLSAVYGFIPYLIIQLTIMTVAATGGVWLFYVQHQFEDCYWEHAQEWDFFDAAMKGSSFYKLPKVLQWFSGNIGFHHIHHLSSKIPNYNLERCHKSNQMFQDVEPLTLFGSLKTLNYRLWDEERKKLISFGQLKRQLRAMQSAA